MLTGQLSLSFSILTAISRWTWVSQTRMFPFWILLKLLIMEALVTIGDIGCAKLQSYHHHQQTNTQIFTGWISFLSPNQQCQNTEGKVGRKTHCVKTVKQSS